MEAFVSLKPLAAVLVSLLAAVLILASGRQPNLRESWTAIAAVAKFLITLSMLPDVLQGRYPEVTLLTIAPGIPLALKVDAAGIIFGLSASALWILTSMYSVGYVRGLQEHNQTRYFASFAACLSTTMGLAFSANLFTFFIFYELLTIATYPLVIHKETPEAICAGRKYLAYLLFGGVALLFAVALTYQSAGSLDFQAGGFLTADAGKAQLMLIFFLFLIGFGTKAAIMPLHSWLPTAMAAPTPVSALLHAVAVVKAGVFGFVRAIGFTMGPELLSDLGALAILAGLSGATIILASLLAFTQDNLKLRLAYSTVGHLSYIVLGIALLSPSAWAGGLMHIVTHAAMKITLFFCAGAIYVKTHCENVSQLDGIGRQMPLTLGAFALAAIGLAGIPPIGGFISKWYLVQGTLATDDLVLVAVLLVSGLLNAGYLFPIVARAFFNSSPSFSEYDEASLLMVIPLVLTAILSVLLGIFPDQFFHLYYLASTVADGVLGGGGR